MFVEDATACAKLKLIKFEAELQVTAAPILKSLPRLSHKSTSVKLFGDGEGFAQRRTDESGWLE